jgi:hypothetical protein
MLSGSSHMIFELTIKQMIFFSSEIIFPVIIFVRGGYRKKSVVHESSGTPCGDVCHRSIVVFFFI